MQCIYNGSSLARFVPEIRPVEKKRAGINNSVYSESWLLLTDHFGPVFIVEHFSCARAVFISAMFSVQLQIFVRSVFIKLGVGGCASRCPTQQSIGRNWPCETWIGLRMEAFWKYTMEGLGDFGLLVDEVDQDNVYQNLFASIDRRGGGSTRNQNLKINGLCFLKFFN